MAASRERRELDPFESEVRLAMEMFAPFDALELYSALRVSTGVLVHTILQQHEAHSAGVPRCAPYPSAHRDTLARLVMPVMEWVRDHREAYVTSVAWRVVLACFERVGERSYLDTDEIPLLVGVAHAVGLELWDGEREVASRLIDPARRPPA